MEQASVQACLLFDPDVGEVAFVIARSVPYHEWEVQPLLLGLTRAELQSLSPLHMQFPDVSVLSDGRFQATSQKSDLFQFFYISGLFPFCPSKAEGYGSNVLPNCSV